MKATDTEQRLPVPGTRDELDELANAFNDLLVRLQEAYARQARFTGEASHQLRTPLTALLGQVEIALRQQRTTGEYRQVLQQVQRQGRQLVRIVEMLLFLARADAQTEMPEQELLELNGWLTEYLESWAKHPRSADLRLQLPDRTVCVLVHPVLLGQLLDNLLDNACKYSKPGSPITITLSAQSGQAALEVTDRGIGIAQDDLSHLFEPLFRSSSVRRLGVPGAGLGLAIVKRIAEGLGAIDVQSQPGVGSSFTLTLPSATDDQIGDHDQQQPHADDGVDVEEGRVDARQVVGPDQPVLVGQQRGHGPDADQKDDA
jgi:signal transduction histidine kinase